MRPSRSVNTMSLVEPPEISCAELENWFVITFHVSFAFKIMKSIHIFVFESNSVAAKSM